MFRSAKATRASRKAKAAAAGAAPSAGDRFIRRYRAFCYRLLGDRLDKDITAEDLAERLKQAGVNVTPGMHTAVTIITTVFATIASFAASLLLFRFLVHSPLWYGYVLLITGITAGATAGAFRLLVGTRITNRKDQLERELPFTLSELSVLASTGTSPIELVRRMARRDHDPAMTAEFKKIVYKADVQGKDLITALAETAKESPSTSFREALWDLANMIHQGGNLDEYLRQKSEDVLKLKRLIQQQFIERLTTFVDMYVSLVLVGTLMIGVGAFLLGAFGSTVGGLDANALLLLLTYGMLPIAVVVTSILISMAYARAE